MINNIKTFEGGIAVDDRGSVRFVNNFKFTNVKRFYQVNNFSLNTIRAFHGHVKEGKYVYVVTGAIILCAVRLTNIKNPSKKVKVNRFVLSDKKPQIIYIPPGYANGFKVLKSRTSVLFFSTSSLKQSAKDDHRYPFDYWGGKIWEVDSR